MEEEILKNMWIPLYLGSAEEGVINQLLKLMVVGILAMSVIACIETARSGAEEKNGVDLRKNLVYSTRGDEELKLDLAIPSWKKGPFPSIVFVHKGLWYVSTGGAKDEHRDDIILSAKRGFVGVSPNYRAIEKDPSEEGYRNAFPAPLHDFQNVIRWLRINAEEYSIDPEHIGA